MVEKVGVVGVGAMGLPLALRMSRGGFSVAVFDQSPSALTVAQEHGLAAADDLAHMAADSDVVVTSLPDGGVLAAVVGWPGSAQDCLANGLNRHLLVVDTSSCAPDQSRTLGRTMAQFGATLVDAPVSGGVARAWKGDLTVMVGGDEGPVASVRPLLDSFGSVVVNTGGLGTGHAMKALNNFVSAATLTAASEALIMGARFGLAPETMVKVFNASTARSDATERKLPNHILTRSYDSGFALWLMAKDLRNAASLAGSVDLQPVLVHCVGEIWQQAESEIGAGADHTEIARWLGAVLMEGPDR